MEADMALPDELVADDQVLLPDELMADEHKSSDDDCILVADMGLPVCCGRHCLVSDSLTAAKAQWDTAGHSYEETQSYVFSQIVQSHGSDSGSGKTFA